MTEKNNEIVEKGRALLSSKTFWFNILTGITAVAMLFGFGEFQPSEDVVKIIGIINALGNIYIRLHTSEPITRIK